MKIVVKRGKRDKSRGYWVLVSGNGNVASTSRLYCSVRNARRAAKCVAVALVGRWCDTAGESGSWLEIDDET